MIFPPCGLKWISKPHRLTSTWQKCDGAKPKCTSCLHTGTDCIYRSARSVAMAENVDRRRQLDAADADQRKFKDHLKLVNLLRKVGLIGSGTC